MKTHATTQLGSCRTAALLGGLVLALTLPGSGLKAQMPEISKSVLVSWPDPAQEQIVVGSDSPTGPVWTPWPEPIFKRFGQMCLAVPTTATQQFFKTVSGRQLADDFTDSWWPFTNRIPWTNWLVNPGEDWFVTNGVLKLAVSPGTNSPGFLLLPDWTNAVQDFYTSIDILDWVTSTNNWSIFALIGRGKIHGVTSANGHIGGLVLNSDGIAGNVTLYLWDGYTDVFGPSFDMGANPLPYRLELSQVGNNLWLRVRSLTTKAVIREQALVVTKYTQGWVGLWIKGRNDPGDTFTITADNFFATGTKP